MIKKFKIDLFEKYKKLPYKEKTVIGESLVKVNMGVSQPQDLKRAAEFVKGSDFIAKPGYLDELIHWLHCDEETNDSHEARSQERTTERRVLTEKAMEELSKDDPEDLKATLKEGALKPGDLKHK